MRRLVRGKIIIPFVVLTSIYWLAAWYVPRARIADVVNGMTVAFALAVVVAYIEAFWQALKMPRDRFGRIHHLLIGIVLAWSATLVTRLWSFLYLNTGKPEWMNNHPIAFYFYFVLCLAAALHLSAPADAEKVNAVGFSRTATKHIIVAFFAGAMLSALIIKMGLHVL